jgi:hypothetical protein
VWNRDPHRLEGGQSVCHRGQVVCGEADWRRSGEGGSGKLQDLTNPGLQVA